VFRKGGDESSYFQVDVRSREIEDGWSVALTDERLKEQKKGGRIEEDCWRLMCWSVEG
jgi:hypothetical protein